MSARAWLLILLVAAPVPALGETKQPADGAGGAPLGDRSFGQRGSFVFGGGFGLGGSQQLGSDFDTSIQTDFGPSLDVFLLRRLSWGMNLNLSYIGVRNGGSSTLVQVSPRVGYAVPLGDTLAFWPRLGLSLGAGSLDAQAPNAAGGSSFHTFHQRVVAATLYLPLHFFILPHIALGFGPLFATELLHRAEGGPEARLTTVSGSFEVAGWL